MGRLPGQVGDVLTLLGHVVQHQDDAADLTLSHDRRTYQGDRHGAAVQALDQLGMFTAALEATFEHALDQGQAVLFGILVEQAEQRSQGQALGLGRMPVGQLFGGRVHVGDAAFDIGGDDAIADRLKGDLRPLLLHFEGIGKGLALGQQLA
ncbi:hypothetical protein D3C76_801810 [compost metagenome]